MGSSITLVALFSLALLSGIIEARKYPEPEYSPAAVNEVITKQLVHIESALVNLKKITDYEAYHGHTSEKTPFLKDFEPIPNVSAYGGDNSKLKEHKLFQKYFEPIPNVSAYGDDSKLKKHKRPFKKDFEPIPNVSAYGDDSKLKEHERPFKKDLEPVPNLSAYGDDSKLKREISFQKDFKPIPNVSAYGDDSKLKEGRPIFLRDFQPRAHPCAGDSDGVKVELAEG